MVSERERHKHGCNMFFFWHSCCTLTCRLDKQSFQVILECLHLTSNVLLDSSLFGVDFANDTAYLLLRMWWSIFMAAGSYVMWLVPHVQYWHLCGDWVSLYFPYDHLSSMVYMEITSWDHVRRAEIWWDSCAQDFGLKAGEVALYLIFKLVVLCEEARCVVMVSFVCFAPTAKQCQCNLAYSLISGSHFLLSTVR